MMRHRILVAIMPRLLCTLHQSAVEDKTGSVRSVTASYRTGGTFIQVNALPLIVTFYGSDDMDAAFVRGLAPDVIDALRPRAIDRSSASRLMARLLVQDTLY